LRKTSGSFKAEKKKRKKFDRTLIAPVDFLAIARPALQLSGRVSRPMTATHRNQFHQSDDREVPSSFSESNVRGATQILGRKLFYDIPP